MFFHVFANSERLLRTAISMNKSLYSYNKISSHRLNRQRARL